MDGRNGLEPFLAGTVPKLVPDDVSHDLRILVGEVEADCRTQIHHKLSIGQHPYQGSFSHSAAPYQVNLQEFVNVDRSLLKHLQQREIGFQAV